MSHYSDSNVAFAHPLRRLLLISFIPGLALCAAASAEVRSAVPGVGTIPLFFTAVLSSVILYVSRNKRIALSDEPSGEHSHDNETMHALLDPIAVFVYDVVLGFLLLLVCIFTWVFRPFHDCYDWCDYSGLMLTSYATVPLIFGFISHFYLAFLALVQAFQLVLGAKPPHCPNCDASLPQRTWFGTRQDSRRQAGYSSLAGGLDEEAERYRDEAEEQVSARRNVATPKPEEDNMVKNKGREEPEMASLSPFAADE